MHPLTCVSGFWNVTNKHGNNYTTWFQHSLKINCPYVFFGDKETIEMIIDSNTFGTFLHVSKNDMKCLFYEIFNQDGIFFSEKSVLQYLQLHFLCEKISICSQYTLKIGFFLIILTT